MSKNTKNPVVLLVCNRCGHMWEPNEGSKIPQCSQCKSSSKHAADDEERAAYIAGARISPYFKEQADNPESDQNSPDESEQDIEDPEIEEIDIDALIQGDDQADNPDEPEKKKSGTSGLTFVIVGALILIGGALVGWFLLSRNGRKNDDGRLQGEVEHLPGSEGFYGMPRHEAF